MIRIVLAIAVVTGLTWLARAQGAPPDSENGRYSYNQVEEGYVRLDMRTGQVALCSRRSTGWSCQAAPDDRAAFEAEISRLQAENATLKKALLDRGLPLPGGLSAPPATARAPEAEIKPPSNADIDRVMSFVEKVWRRLIEMMANIQRDPNKT
jgi:hypothetical protein